MRAGLTALPLLAAGLTLAGCAPPPSPAAAGPAAAAPPASGAPAIADAVYACEDGRTLSARYEGPRARLTVAGLSYSVATAVSASGARYVGEGMQWWTKGMGDGRLSRLAPGETVASDPGVACSTDPSPIAETSPKDAVRVTARYYALLAGDRLADAARLRSDATAPETAEKGLTVAVGAPGPAEGAAGSIYLEAPTTLYRAGKPPEKARVLLRRANDVPGATPDQLRWRIERIGIEAP